MVRRSFGATLLAFVLFPLLLQLYHLLLFEHIDTDFSDSLSQFRTAENRNAESIAIVGAGGSIGSYLQNYLDDRFESIEVFGQHAVLPKAAIQRHQTIIFLEECVGSECDESVNRLVDLVRAMSPPQHLIAISTGAVLEGQFDANESAIVRANDLSAIAKTMYDREVALGRVADDSAPKVTILRLGSVVGIAPNQSVFLPVQRWFFEAYTEGSLRVHSANRMLSFLWIQDLGRAFEAVIYNKDKYHPIRSRAKGGVCLWHLSSFHVRALKVATTIASLTGARLRLDGVSNETGSADDSLALRDGYSLNCDSFHNSFNFNFTGSLDEMLLDFEKHVPFNIAESTPDKVNGRANSIPCPICGSRDHQLVRNIELRRKKKKTVQRPVLLVRCRQCNHYHLSEIPRVTQSAERKSTNYDWLAWKILLTANMQVNSSILDIACGTGLRLDSFSQFGWNTYGVDSSEDNYNVAKAKNHTVHLGSWPVEFPELREASNLAAIVAGNSISMVADPVLLLKGCVRVMSSSTKLYIQLPQCSIQRLEDLADVHGERLSTFSTHSFVKAIKFSGLDIIEMEMMPIHLQGCLVTLTRKKEKSAEPVIDALMNHLHHEKEQGVTTDFFTQKYRIRDYLKLRWMFAEVEKWFSTGHLVGALLDDNSEEMVDQLFHRLKKLEYDCRPYDFGEKKTDDAYLTMPIHLLNETNIGKAIDDRWLVLIPTFPHPSQLSDLVLRFKNNTDATVFLLTIDPIPQLIRYNTSTAAHEVLKNFRYDPTAIPNPLRDENRKKVRLYSHMRNEKMLMPFFIIHHAHMFDSAIFLDYLSEDNTRNMIEAYAPNSWRVVNSTTGSKFDAVALDRQVSALETVQYDDWAIALTVPEFLVYPNLRLELFTLNTFNRGMHVLPLKRLEMVGNDTIPLRHFAALPVQRYTFGEFFTNRFLHYGAKFTYGYKTGRHGLVLVNGTKCRPKCTFPVHSGGFIMAYVWTPWPEGAPRKLAIGKTVPKGEVVNKRTPGFHHINRILGGMKYVEEERDQKLAGALHSLCDYDGDSSYSTHRSLFFKEFEEAC